LSSVTSSGGVVGEDADDVGAPSDLAVDALKRVGAARLDAGALERAHELEALGYLHMAIQEPLGTGFSSAVKVHP